MKVKNSMRNILTAGLTAIVLSACTSWPERETILDHKSRSPAFVNAQYERKKELKQWAKAYGYEPLYAVVAPHYEIVVVSDQSAKNYKLKAASWFGGPSIMTQKMYNHFMKSEKKRLYEASKKK